MSTAYDDLLGGEVRGDPAKGEATPADLIQTVTSAIDYPTVFADGVWFCMQMGGTVRMQFIENIPEPANATTPGLRARHVGTLAMPLPGFLSMVKYLSDRAADFQREIGPENTPDGQ